MGKQSCNVKNHKAASAKGASDEPERTPETVHDIASRSRSKISPERTHLNYQLHEPEKGKYKDYGATIDRMIKQHRKEKRLVGQIKLKGDESKQSNVLTTFVLGSGREHFTYSGEKGKRDKNGFYDFAEIDQEKARRFMEDTYDFLCCLVGKENIISAPVHMDESTPHMQAAVVPFLKVYDDAGNEVGVKLHCTDFWAEKLLSPEQKAEYKKAPYEVDKQGNLKTDKYGKPIEI